MINLGTVRPGSVLYIPFDSYAGSTGASAATTGLAVGDIKIFKNGSTTERSSTSGFTLLDTDGLDFDGITGLNGFSIDLADNADAGFYVAGARYWIVISSVTIDSQTVNFTAATFRIGYEGALLDTTLATLASQTSFTLTAGSADNDAYNGCVAVVHDIASGVQIALGVIADYTGSTKTVTLAADPAIFTMAAGDNISIFPRPNVHTFTDAALTAAAIATDAITAAKIAANAIGSAEIADGAITAAKIATDAIDADAFADGAITAATFAAGAIDATAIASGAIDADALAADAITSAKIAANAIGSAEIADGAITAAKIATDAIDADALADGAITAATFATGAIDATAIAADAITAAKVATGAIDADALATDAVNEIVAGILAGEITELGGVPAASPTLEQALALLYMALRNKQETTATTTKIHNDAGSAIATATLADDGTTFTKGEYA